MSIYGFILCNDCKVRRWIKDSDTPIDGDLIKSGQFFEDHKNHQLEYVHEEDGRIWQDAGWKDYE